ATPELVVAIAANPASSKMRALAASQAFGNTRISEPACKERKWMALSFWRVEGITITSSAYIIFRNQNRMLPYYHTSASEAFGIANLGNKTPPGCTAVPAG